jgi:hypothetical protein
MGRMVLTFNLMEKRSVIGAENVESQSLLENVMEHPRAWVVLRSSLRFH